MSENDAKVKRRKARGGERGGRTPDRLQRNTGERRVAEGAGKAGGTIGPARAASGATESDLDALWDIP